MTQDFYSAPPAALITPQGPVSIASEDTTRKRKRAQPQDHRQAAFQEFGLTEPQIRLAMEGEVEITDLPNFTDADFAELGVPAEQASMIRESANNFQLVKPEVCMEGY